MNSAVEDEFRAAAEFVRRSKQKASNEEKLQLYALFKQATEGQCSSPKPSFFDMIGRSKWNAWHNLSDLDKETAAKRYIDCVTKLLPSWRSVELSVDLDEDQGGHSSTFGAPSVSTMTSSTSDEKRDTEKTLADWCVEDNLVQVRQMLSADRSAVNAVDDEGMTPLHWVCDRGYAKLAVFLLEQGASVNAQDPSGQTPLHFATACEHVEVICSLLAAGADVTIRSKDGTTPVDDAETDEIRELLASKSAP